MLRISSWKDDRNFDQTSLVFAEMTLDNKRFLESLQDSRFFCSVLPVVSLALNRRLIAAVPPGQSQIQGQRFRRKSIPGLNRARSHAAKKY